MLLRLTKTELMMGFWQRAMIAVACSKPLRRAGEAVGWKTGLAAQFVSGADGAEHLKRTQELAKHGIRVSSFYLGEYVTDPAQVAETVDAITAVIPKLDRVGLDVHVSIDPSQLGYMQDPAMLDDNAHKIAGLIRNVGGEKAGRRCCRMMIDMEDFDMVDDTLALHDRLLEAGYPVAQTLQARLLRTEADMARKIAQGAMIRLVKGAMAPPDHVAFTRRRDIDENYLKLASMMLSDEARLTGFMPVFGSHHRELVEYIAKVADERGWEREAFEFEMLYGVNQPLQRDLVSLGYRLRLYAPFGGDWWAYAWRRVGENPHNLGLLLRSRLNATGL